MNFCFLLEIWVKMYMKTNQRSKFRTRNWFKINDESRGDYNDDNSDNNDDNNNIIMIYNDNKFMGL